MHIWNRVQRIKSVKMGVETSDNNQCSYFFVLNRILMNDKYINRCILRSHPVKFFLSKKIHTLSCIQDAMIRFFQLQFFLGILFRIFIYFFLVHSKI